MLPQARCLRATQAPCACPGCGLVNKMQPLCPLPSSPVTHILTDVPHPCLDSEQFAGLALWLLCLLTDHSFGLVLTSSHGAGAPPSSRACSGPLPSGHKGAQEEHRGIGWGWGGWDVMCQKLLVGGSGLTQCPFFLCLGFSPEQFKRPTHLPVCTWEPPTQQHQPRPREPRQQLHQGARVGPLGRRRRESTKVSLPSPQCIHTPHPQ